MAFASRYPSKGAMHHTASSITSTRDECTGTALIVWIGGFVT